MNIDEDITMLMIGLNNIGGKSSVIRRYVGKKWR